MKDSSKLSELLKMGGNYYPHYGNRLATHLPMALIALSRMGADDEKLTSFFEQSIEQLELIDDSEPMVSIEQINQHLGDSSKYLSYLKYFKAQIKCLGFEVVIK